MAHSDRDQTEVSSDLPNFAVQRLGVVMEPDPGDPQEALGVLNPACARTPDGDLLLFPRVVAAGNYSRIGIARVLFNSAGDPSGVERLGYALEPAESYEINRVTAGCEDPRVTYIAELGTYLMAYTAFGPLGPRVALARSDDLITWRRLGLAKLAPMSGTEFDFYINKDALIFPEPVTDPHGHPAIALIHRPDFYLDWSGLGALVLPDGVTESRPSIWLSYCPLELLDDDLSCLPPFRDHHLLITPLEPWEHVKIGGGTAPIRTDHGWLTLYHGVSGELLPGFDHQPNVYYAAGALVLDHMDPRRILYRSSQPVLIPNEDAERRGVVDNVVFPTALDPRDGGRVDVYYGMADARIGVGRLQIPDQLPSQVSEALGSAEVA